MTSFGPKKTEPIDENFYTIKLIGGVLSIFLSIVLPLMYKESNYEYPPTSHLIVYFAMFVVGVVLTIYTSIKINKEKKDKLKN